MRLVPALFHKGGNSLLVPSFSYGQPFESALFLCSNTQLNRFNMKHFILFAFILAGPLGLTAQDAKNPGHFEYVTIISDSRRPDDVFISNSNGTYERKRVKVAGKFDYSGILSVVGEKESVGFELFDSSFSTFDSNVTAPHNYFLMRRPVPRAE